MSRNSLTISNYQRIPLNYRILEAVPKLQFLNSNLRFNGKSGHLAAFFKKLLQNQPGF
jgi:hypothetical protein